MTLGDGIDSAGVVLVILAIDRLQRAVTAGIDGLRQDFRAYVVGRALPPLPVARRRARRPSAPAPQAGRQPGPEIEA